MKTRTASITRGLGPLICAALTTMAAPRIVAQPTAAASANSNEDSDVVELSPFEVKTDNDSGYRATNTITGSRLNTLIKDIPMPIEVITEQFIRDTGSNDLRESLRYSAGIVLQSQNDQGTPGGAYQGPGGVNNPEQGATANKSQSSFKLRGYVSDSVLRDGYRRRNSTDSVNISRIEVVRGPAALLYGTGMLGGLVNYLPKMPRAQTAGEMTVAVGTYGFMRTSFDFSGPIDSDGRLGYRLTGALEKNDDWTDYKNDKHYFIAPLFTYKLTPSTDLLVEIEKGKEWQEGTGFQRVRGSGGTLGTNNDQHEHAGFWNLPGTDPRTFRWSGPDTYLDTDASNMRAQVTQRLIENMYFKAGFNRSAADFDQRDVIGNLRQGVGPVELRDTVFLTPLDPSRGSSNLQIRYGEFPDNILQYRWADTKTENTLDQFRGEVTYSFNLFERSSEWLRIESALLAGYSREKAHNDITSSYTQTNQYNFKRPTDASPIRFGTQGDGTPDVPMILGNGTDTLGWNEGLYGVYQGKLLDDRVTIVGGIRRDTNWNEVTTLNYVNATSTSRSSEKQRQTTDQLGITVAITPQVSVFALKAEGVEPNLSGYIDINGDPMGAILAKSKEAGVKIDLFEGRISGTASVFKIERDGTPRGYWWAPTSDRTNFDPSRPIVYNVNNVRPGSNGGNGAVEASMAQWNAGLASGAIYSLPVGSGTSWYVNASTPEGAAYLDAIFDYTKANRMTWPGWLYNYDANSNNSWNDRTSGPGGMRYVAGADSAKGWDAQIIVSPINNLQFTLSYAHVERVIDKAGQFARYPHPEDRWAVWYFPNTDWGLTGKPLDVVYTDSDDSSTWTGIGYGSGEKQDDTPDHHVSFWSNYTFPEGRFKGLSVGLGGWWESPREFMSGLTHGGGQRVTDANGTLLVLETKDRLNIDMMARYRFKLAERDAYVQLNVRNLLDDQKLYGLIYSYSRRVHLEFGLKF